MEILYYCTLYSQNNFRTPNNTPYTKYLSPIIHKEQSNSFVQNLLSKKTGQDKSIITVISNGFPIDNTEDSQAITGIGATIELTMTALIIYPFSPT